MSPGGLGRRPFPDAKDHAHLMRMALPDVVPPRPKSKAWRIWWYGSQGQTSQCVGFAWHALLRAKPMLQRDPAPDFIYHEAQKVDEWEGEDYDGTSVRAGAKVLQAAGKLVSYSWAFDVETVLNWIAFKGPVVLGTTWFEGMDHPDENGIVLPTGAERGGHAYTALTTNEKLRLVGCQQSWPKPWGKNGRFFIRYEDLDQLIQNGGEACTPTEAVEI